MRKAPNSPTFPWQKSRRAVMRFTSMSDAVRQDRDISSRRIQICNEHGHVLSTFSMKDAITSDE